MQINVTVPTLDQLPVGYYVIAGVIVYYWIAGFVINRWVWPRSAMESGDIEEPRIFLWILSPFIPFLFIAYFIMLTVLWAVSGGLILPPWRHK